MSWIIITTWFSLLSLCFFTLFYCKDIIRSQVIFLLNTGVCVIISILDQAVHLLISIQRIFADRKLSQKDDISSFKFSTFCWTFVISVEKRVISSCLLKPKTFCDNIFPLTRKSLDVQNFGSSHIQSQRR